MMLPMALFTRTVNVTFSVPLKNGFRAVLGRCLHITLKRSKVPLTKMVKLTVHVNKPYQLFYSCISKVIVLRIQTGTCNNDAAKMSRCSMLL